MSKKKSIIIKSNMEGKNPMLANKAIIVFIVETMHK
jgi:hypothetical protein